MKIIMVAAVSQDGYITKGTDPDVSKWTSTEDKEFFAKIKSKHRFFVMGSKTYDSGAVIAKPGTLKIILTKNPKKYASQQIDGQLEFENLSAQELNKIYGSKYKTCLLLGGGITYTEFLEANLVDEIYLTVEPLEFKSGTPLLANTNTLSDFTDGIEPEITVLNNSNTVLKHYILKK
jgi:dihydrofolate reductase